MKNFSFIIKKLKLNKEKPLLKHISLLLASVILLTVAVWAWFAANQNADADGLNVTMASSKNLEISLDGGSTYHYGLDLLSDSDQEFIGESNKIKDKLNMLDITSDGKTFLRPVFTQTDNNRMPDVNQTWSPANKNSAYISQTVHFKTSFPAEIYMGAGTTITTYCEKNELDLVGINAGNKSTYGDFSTDCIVGALRISAVDNKGNLCFTMIPRSDIELIVDNDEYSVVTGDNVSENAKKHTYFASDYLTKQDTTTNDNPLLAFTATSDSKPSASTTKLTETVYNTEKDYYEGVATVNVWLEGCDPETRRALSGGKYNIVLDFVAFEIASATE